MTSSGRTIKVDIWRGSEEGDYQSFEVPERDNQTVLDVVTYIQRHLDSALAYRFACRVGVCGSCAMTVNGRPRWTCRTHVSRVVKGGKLTIAPLRNLPVIRDLVTDMAPFFDKWNAARGRFVAGDGPKDELAPVSPEQKERAAASEAIECINCGVCYSACDVVSWRDDYLGPAALNRAWAAYNDVRDGDRPGILKAVSQSGGCHNCHTHQSCAEHCPVSLNPTFSIAGLKRASLKAKLKGGLSE
ncbi:MAG: succinate dehydrogenase/fumarate reductase iron-sulfur subunit [Alphaproteobacteria bacterium]